MLGRKLWFKQSDLQCSFGTVIVDNYDGYYTVLEDETGVVWIVDAFSGVKKWILKTDEQILQEVYMEMASLMEFEHDKTVWKKIALESMKRSNKLNLKLIKEYFFNTAEIGKNIDENYLKQTVKFLNDLNK